MTLIDVNPYAPPIESPAKSDDPLVVANARLARPATALIVMASTQSVFASIILVCGIARPGRGEQDQKMWVKHRLAAASLCYGEAQLRVETDRYRLGFGIGF